MDGTPVVDVDRGGKITWHGPGQLVGYPILRLPDPIDVVAYVRRVEQVLIDVCAELGRAAGARRGPQRRLGARRRARPRSQDRGDRHPGGPGRDAARVRAQLRLRPAVCDRIVPCGIPDAGVTSLSAELGRDVTVTEVLPLVRRRLGEVLAGALA